MKSPKFNTALVCSLILGVQSIAFADSKVYRSHSGGSEAANVKVIRSVDDAKLYKDEDGEKEMRARPIYEELNENEDTSIEKKNVITKKVYTSRSGSGMARPKIVVQQ